MARDGLGEMVAGTPTVEEVSVLFVDNDADFADVSKTMLERADESISVTIVPNGTAAIEVVEEPGRQVDCIVSDYDMPEMDGLALLQAVRERDDRLPFVLFTGKGSEEIASDAIAAGVTQYLQKKPGRERYALLGNQIRNAVAQYRTQSALQDRVRQQEAVATIGQQALNEPQLDVLFETTVRRVARALDVSHVRVLSLPESDAELRTEAAVGWRPDAPASGQARYAVDDGKPVVVVDDLSSEDRFDTSDAAEVEELRSGACATVGLRGSDWGVLEAHARTHRRFTQDDVTFLQNVATVLASAIERNVIEGERQESTERYRTLVEVSPSAVAVHRDGDLVYTNPAFVSLVGATDETELLGSDLASLVHPEDEEAVTTAMARTLAGEAEPTRRERRVVGHDGAVVHVEMTSRAIEYEGERAVLTVATDVTERKRYEETLDTLHETSRDLMRAETRADICRTAAETAADLLGLSALVVYTFESDTGVLDPAATTPSTSDLLGSPPPVERGSGYVWETFSEGESRYFPDVADEPGRLADGVESQLVIPLGTHGALVAVSDTVEGFEESTIELLHILAANTEAAMDRAEREQLLRDHDSRLTQQNEELRKLNHTNSIVRDVNRAVAQASTRREIEQAVCDRLAEAEPYVAVWVAEAEGPNGAMTPLAWSNTDADYVDRIDDDVDDQTPEGTLVRQAVDTQEVVVVEDVLTDEWSERRTEALTYGFQTVVAVPLVDNERVYSVLVLHVATPETVTEQELAVLGELGETIGHAIHAVERTRALVTDSVVELEFDVADERFTFSRLSAAVGGTIRLDGSVARPDGTHLCFVRTEGIDPELVESTLADWSSVPSVACINEDGETTLFEMRLTEPRLFELLREYDGTIQSLSATDGVATLIVELPQGGDTRGLWNDLSESYPTTELAARRETSQANRQHRTHRSWVEGELTERQFEALQSAYYAGFYDWPREVTGEVLAEALDVTPPTYHYHLRAAERKLVSGVFESGSN
jgi:PAS domain S-box-containing protein